MALPAGSPSPKCPRAAPCGPSSSADELVFAACLDNARKCFLMLKCTYLPLALVYGVIASILNVLWVYGHVPNFSNTFFVSVCINIFLMSVPAFLVPVIIRLRSIPPSVRLAISNTVFAAVCLLVPMVSAHKVWRRQYHELSGFLALHDLLPSPPPRARPSIVSPHEPLSICEDDIFFLLYAIDHTHMAASNFKLWTFIELPPNYFAVSFSLHIVHFWASAYRVASAYVSVCSRDAKHVSGTVLLPLIHMVHIAACVTFMLAKFCMMSQHRETNKKWIHSLMMEAFLTTKVHVQSLWRHNSNPLPPRNCAFWSRTDLLHLQPVELPLLLPSSLGIALKVCARLKDMGMRSTACKYNQESAFKTSCRNVCCRSGSSHPV